MSSGLTCDPLMGHRRFGAALGPALRPLLSPSEAGELNRVKHERQTLHWPAVRRCLVRAPAARDAVIGVAYAVAVDADERERVVMAFLRGLRDGSADVEAIADEIQLCCAADAARH